MYLSCKIVVIHHEMGVAFTLKIWVTKNIGQNMFISIDNS